MITMGAHHIGWLLFKKNDKIKLHVVKSQTVFIALFQEKKLLQASNQWTSERPAGIPRVFVNGLAKIQFIMPLLWMSIYFKDSYFLPFFLLDFFILYSIFFSAHWTHSIQWYFNMLNRGNTSLLVEVIFLFYTTGLFCGPVFTSGNYEDAYLSKRKCKMFVHCKRW